MRLLDEAGRLLSEEGPAALSLRRLAADVGTSTSAVYSLFGGKPELMRAVYLEASRRFGHQLSSVERTDDPLGDLARLGLAYREFAIGNPHLYAVLFSRPMPEFEPDDDARNEALSSFNVLVDLVKAAIDAGLLLDSPDTVTWGLWAIVHGLVTLELENNLPDDVDPAERFATVVLAALRGWTITPPSF